MLANIKTQFDSAQRWLASQIPIPQDDQRSIERERARQIALDAVNAAERPCLSLDYLQSAEHFIGYLRAAQESVTASMNERSLNDDDFKDWHTLARLYEHLGQYSEAQKCYATAQFLLSTGHPSHTRILRDFARFLAETRHNPDLAEQICDNIQSLGMNERRGTDDAESSTSEGNRSSMSEAVAAVSIVDDMETLSLVLCQKERFEEALTYIDTAKFYYRKDGSISANLALCWAITSTGLQDRERAETEFCRALILCALNLGNWHLKTLCVLHAYATALWNWDRHADAAALFTECYIGRYYRLGPHHRSTEETYSMVKRCGLSQEQRDILRIFRGCSTYRLLRSLAYEHMELWTVADILGSLENSDFRFAESLIEHHLEHANILRMRPTRLESVAKRIVRFKRAMAACESKLGSHIEAATRLKFLMQEPGPIRINNTMMLQCKMDRAIYLSRGSTRGANDPKVQELSQSVFYESDMLLESYEEERHSLISAFRTHLAKHNLTHFEWHNLPEIKGSPFEFRANLGHGNYGWVQRVRLKGVEYAQKMTSLKGTYASQKRRQTKEEVGILKRLCHPHVVQVYCTFEEGDCFAIVMEPLASGDLDQFLSQQSRPLELSPLIEKWLGCLTVTLAFIHDHGIKHRDIKPKNILVNNGLVLFSDFGSSKLCLETGMSTDGPAYGHTKTYSAPEVIAQERRNESADIFSLGCVFTEMVSVLCGRSLGCYDSFRGSVEYRRMPYHESLDQVEAWFTDDEHMPAWGAKMYAAFLKPMLDARPESRPSAQETALAIRAHFQAEKLASETFCQACFQYCLAEV
ncbi:kinase-like protein [Trematosphaeria pertusa]|uniref:Kinase-like protein n=1 Tax=Trematosphaeria pertusa TaxID=390896 RepID=A0A6A6I5L7_9PLEO|nr:kinase-like protein [Trematosphaeria pertusa]KAF2245617.1 kinase-like protein [Trematosphaeria pertusa]